MSPGQVLNAQKVNLETELVLNITPESVINSLTISDELNANQSRVFSYLKTFIGNLADRV